jgi:hypothetical protein
VSKVYDVVATVGEYTDRAGNTKKRYMNIGAVFKTDKGFSMKLESVPVDWNGWANFYEPKPIKDTAAAAPKPTEDVPFDDAIPF